MATLLVTAAFALGAVASFLSSFLGFGLVGALFGLFLGWMAFVGGHGLLHHRSDDDSVKAAAIETVNMWGFIWIGVFLGAAALGIGFALLEPRLGGIDWVAVSWRLGAVIGTVAAAAGIYQAARRK